MYNINICTHPSKTISAMRALQHSKNNNNNNNDSNANSNSNSNRQIDESMSRHGKYLKHRHRRYHKVTAFSEVQQAFIDYLLQQGYDVTLKVFQEELQDKANQHNKNNINRYSSIEPPTPPAIPNTRSILYQMQQIQHSQASHPQQWQAWILAIKQAFTGTHTEWMRLEFMLTVWKLSITANVQHDGALLKHYIQQHGTVLSEWPQLLPYFALPYMGEPRSHPYLSRIYSPQFTEEIVQMMGKYISTNTGNMDMSANINAEREQNQWYAIVKDLINICMQFGQQCVNNNNSNNNNNNSNSNRYEHMLQRVKKYQQVIANNEDMHIGDSRNRQQQQQYQQHSSEHSSIGASQLSRLLFVTNQHHSYEQSLPADRQQHGSQLNSKRQRQGHSNRKQLQIVELAPLDYQRVKIMLPNMEQHPTSSSSQGHRRCCLILHALNQRLTTAPIPTRRLEISSYIDHDILSLHRPSSPSSLPSSSSSSSLQLQLQHSYYGQIECLKLVNTICLYSSGDAGIQYVGQCDQYVRMLCSIVEQGRTVYANISGRVSRSRASSQTNNNKNNNGNNNKGSKINNNKGNVSNSSRTAGQHSENSDGIALEQRVLECLGILQKVSTLKAIVIRLTNTTLLATLLAYLQNYKELPSTVLTYVLAILLNLLLHPSNKQSCSKMIFTCSQPSNNNNVSVSRSATKQPKQISLLQLMVRVWQHVQTNNTRFYRNQMDSQLESFVYSIMYMLLGVHVNKDIATRIELMGRLQAFLQTKRTQQSQEQLQYYNKVIPELARVYQSKQQQQSGQQWQLQPQQQLDGQSGDGDYDDESEQDAESEVKGYLWVGNHILQLSELEAQHHEQQVLAGCYASNSEQPKHIQPQKQHQHQHQHQHKYGIVTHKVGQHDNPKISTNMMKQQSQIAMNKKVEASPNVNTSNRIAGSRQNSTAVVSSKQQKQCRKMQNKSAVRVQANKDTDMNKLRNASEVYMPNKKNQVLGNKNYNNNGSGAHEYDRLSGYNPAKYQAWKRLKTTKQ